MKKTTLFKKVASVLMALAMIILAIPAIEAKADQVISASFKNTEGWSSVYVYVWDDAQNTLMGSWPGTDITSTASDGYYTAVLPEMDADSVNIIFSGGDGQPQTVDLKLDLTKGLEWWVVPNGNEGGKLTCSVDTSKAGAEAGGLTSTTPDTPTTTPDTPTSVTESPVIDGNTVTFYFESDSANSVAVAGSMNNWSTTEWMMTKGDGNIFSYTCTLDAGSYQYKFVVDGATWVQDLANPNGVDDGYGGLNSAFDVTAGGGNGGSTSTPDDTPSLIPENPTIEKSPVINGNEVTFYFESEVASNIVISGSMNNWSTDWTMTKDGNVFSYTCTLEAGTYQYKYIVDGTWMVDPFNANTVTDESGNENSSFEVTGTGATTPDEPSTEGTNTEDTNTENTTTEDASPEDTQDNAGDANKDDAAVEGTPSNDGLITVISAIVTIVIVLGGYAGYVIYKKKKA